jgi:micrococcal nuclease
MTAIVAACLLVASACSAAAPRPRLQITDPATGSTVTSETVTIRGTASAGSRIVHDITFGADDETIAGTDGSWTLAVKLDEGPNDLTFRIGDDADTGIRLELTLAPEAAVVPPPTAMIPAARLEPTGETVQARVVEVVDGDTIKVELDGETVSVRYIGIDSPETRALDSPLAWMGPEATKANAELVEGRTVVLEKDVSETDQHGRLLRHVWLETESGLILVNLELVKRGFAQLMTHPPDVKYVDILTEAEELARSTALGLWGPEPTAAPTATPKPAPTPLIMTFADPHEISGSAERFTGAAGTYNWSDVSFPGDEALVKATAKSTSSKGCRMQWIVDPAGARIGSTIEVTGKDTRSKSRHFETSFLESALDVISTCASWSVAISEYVPAPLPLVGGGGGSCHASYDPCLPIVGDLDCPDVRALGMAPVSVIGPDSYRLDRDSDGIGCE